MRTSFCFLVISQIIIRLHHAPSSFVVATENVLSSYHHKLTGNPWPCLRPALGCSVLSSPSDRSMSRQTQFWLVDSCHVTRPRPLIGQWAATLASDWSLSRACPWHQEAVRTRTVVAAVVLLLLGCHHPLIMDRATTEFSGIRTLKSVKQAMMQCHNNDNRYW